MSTENKMTLNGKKSEIIRFQKKKKKMLIKMNIKDSLS